MCTEKEVVPRGSEPSPLGLACHQRPGGRVLAVTTVSAERDNLGSGVAIGLYWMRSGAVANDSLGCAMAG